MRHLRLLGFVALLVLSGSFCNLTAATANTVVWVKTVGSVPSGQTVNYRFHNNTSGGDGGSLGLTGPNNSNGGVGFTLTIGSSYKIQWNNPSVDALWKDCFVSGGSGTVTFTYGGESNLPDGVPNFYMIGASAPEHYCFDGQLQNLTGVAQQYEIYFQPVSGANALEALVWVSPGQTLPVHVGPKDATGTVSVSQKPAAGSVYLGDGMYSDAPSGFFTFFGPTDTHWYVCGGVTNLASVSQYPGQIPIPGGTNNPINFSSATNNTNAATDGTIQAGFNALANLQQASVDRLLQQARDSGVTLSNISGSFGQISAAISSNSAVLAQIRDLISSNSAAGSDGDITNDTAGLASDLASAPARALGSLTNDAAFQAISSATNDVATAATAAGSNLTGLGAAEDSFWSIEFGSGPTHVHMDFDPRHYSLGNTVASWVRLFLTAFFTMMFFRSCYERAQKYLWDVLKASAVSNIRIPGTDGGGLLKKAATAAVPGWVGWILRIFSLLGDKAIGYAVVAATMAVIATIPSFVVLWLTSNGGWAGTVMESASAFHVPSGASTFMLEAFKLMDWIFPIALVTTQFISRIGFELSLSAVCSLALATLRFIKIFSLAFLLWQAAGTSGFAAVVRIENFSGSPVTNKLSDTNVLVFPSGVLTVEIEASAWDWSGGSTVAPFSNGDTVRFSAADVTVVPGHSPLAAFMVGVGIHSALWLAGMGMRAYRSMGRVMVDSATE